MGTIKTTFSNNIDATGKLKEGSLGFSAGTSWQSVFTGVGSTGLTAVAGRGYFIDTTSGTVTVTLPSSPSAGDYVVLKDYARTWATNNITIASNTFDGVSSVTETFSTKGQTVTLVYMDGTKGWSLVNEDTTSGLGAQFVTATGGTVTTSGDYKIHTFIGDGCFVVSSAGNPEGSDTVSYLVVAGGGGSASDRAGGGGAGGYREGYNPGSYTASPLVTSALPVSATTYPVTVGGGGSAGSGGPDGNPGSNSIFSSITSTGGGGGGRSPGTSATGLPGGSGGGSGSVSPHPNGAIGGTGNTPPVSPPQGNSGGTAGNTFPGYTTAGGGGAGAVGGNGGGAGGTGGSAGNGVNTNITGSSVGYSGGGAGATDNPGGQGTPAGPFGGGTAATADAGTPGTAGTANTGGGGGGSAGSTDGGAGGSGIVIIRYKYQ